MRATPSTIRWCCSPHHAPGLGRLTADPIKGWVALRLEGSLAPIHPMWREQFEVLHRRAVSDERFHLTDPRTARTLTFGAFRMAIRDLYLGQVTRIMPTTSSSCC